MSCSQRNAIRETGIPNAVIFSMSSRNHVMNAQEEEHLGLSWPQVKNLLSSFVASVKMKTIFCFFIISDVNFLNKYLPTTEQRKFNYLLGTFPVTR